MFKLAPYEVVIWHRVETRRAQVRQFSDEVQERLDRLDSQFYEYPDDIRKLLQAYLEKAPE